jgi:branched-chain amino acid transport system substrate-binding protein
MKRAIASVGLGICAGILVSGASFAAEDIKIGVLYDYTGPFAGGGSKAAAIGNKIAIDMINEKGGVDGHKIVGIYTDAQSKTDVAINETERLLNEQKVDVIMGVFSSAQCVPMAAKVDAAKKLFWANVCVSSAVFKGKNLQYVFRANIHSDQYGEASCSFINDWAKLKFGKEPKDLKIAIIYEDGLMVSASRRPTKSAARRSGCRSCTRSRIRRPRRTCRRWSPSCAARSPTSSCIPATIRTSRCSCARPRKRA